MVVVADDFVGRVLEKLVATELAEEVLLSDMDYDLLDNLLGFAVQTKKHKHYHNLSSCVTLSNIHYTCWNSISKIMVNRSIDHQTELLSKKLALTLFQHG